MARVTSCSGYRAKTEEEFSRGPNGRPKIGPHAKTEEEASCFSFPRHSKNEEGEVFWAKRSPHNSSPIIDIEFGELRQKLKNWKNALTRAFGNPWVLFGSIPCHLNWFRHFRCFHFFQFLNSSESSAPPNLQSSEG